MTRKPRYQLLRTALRLTGALLDLVWYGWRRIGCAHNASLLSVPPACSWCGTRLETDSP